MSTKGTGKYHEDLLILIIWSILLLQLIAGIAGVWLAYEVIQILTRAGL